MSLLHRRSRRDGSATLSDGSEIVIRPIEPRDRHKMLIGFEALSPQSRYRRFMAPITKLDPRWLTYLTELDHHDHEALVAESPDGEPVGVARYVRLQQDAQAAEAAVTVVDSWQGKGAATALLAALSERAREEGLTSFRATCLADNHAVLELLRGLPGVTHESAHDEVVEIEIELPVEIERGNALHAALKRAAAGALVFRHPARRAAAARDKTAGVGREG